MTTNMVEHVARALLRSKRNGAPEQYSPGWIDKHVDENWHLLVDDARTAIAAMRNPTSAMVKAGTIMWDPMDGGPIRAMFDPTKPYQAMIEEALK